MERKRGRERRPRKERRRKKREWRGRLRVRLAGLRGLKNWGKRRRVSATPESRQKAEDCLAVTMDYPEGQFPEAPRSTVLQRWREMCVCVLPDCVSTHLIISACFHLCMLPPIHVIAHAYYHQGMFSSPWVWYYICMPSHIHVITVSVIIYACHHPCILLPLQYHSFGAKVLVMFTILWKFTVSFSFP